MVTFILIWLWLVIGSLVASVVMLESDMKRKDLRYYRIWIFALFIAIFWPFVIVEKLVKKFTDRCHEATEKRLREILEEKHNDC